MNEALLTLAVLACPLSMVAMMFFMGRGMKRSQDQGPDDPGSLEDLRIEQQRLEAQIGELEGKVPTTGARR